MGSFVGAGQAGANVAALTSGNGAPVAWPAGLAAGDLGIIFWSFGPSATVVTTGPTGFTLAASATDGNDQTRIYSKVLTGSESGNITGWLLDTINRQSAVLYVVRGFASIAAAVSFLETVTGTSHDPPNIATSDGAQDGDSVVICASDRAGSTGPITAPAGFSKRTNTEAVAAGTGGTLTVVADDGLATGATFPVNPAAFTGFTSGGTAVAWTLALRPSNVTLNLGVATETGAALAATFAKTVAASSAPETDSVPAVSLTKALGLNVATGASAVPVAAFSKQAALGVAAETGAAPIAVLSKVAALSRAAEVDTAAAMVQGKALALGRAAETGLAPAATVGKVWPLGVPVETGTALQAEFLVVAPYVPARDTTAATRNETGTARTRNLAGTATTRQPAATATTRE